MFYSPLSTPTLFRMPDGRGLYALPQGPEAPTGWGEPRHDADGARIKPGTPGGSLPYVHLPADGSLVSDKHLQRAGPTSWWGPEVEAGNPGRGRYSLSYNGPVLRYFAQPDFAYGSSPTHSEVYYRGYYADVAPGPVLGACLRVMPYTDPTTQATTNQLWLIVAVYEGGEDRIYRRRFRHSVRADGMTDEVRNGHAAVFDVRKNPEGWRPMGVLPPISGAYPPDTPWFFNESGTEACAMRRLAQTFNNGAGDVTEDRYVRLQATISTDSATLQNVGNEQPMVYVEDYEKIREPYVSTGADGNTHAWQEDHIKVTVSLAGKQVVLCDYLVDQLYLGTMEYDMLRVQREYMTLGVDPDPYYGDVNPGGTNISNAGQYFGPLPYPGDYVIAQADHYWTTWLDFIESVVLKFGPAGGSSAVDIIMHQFASGTSDEWAGGAKREENPYLYYYATWTRELRGALDLRRLLVASLTDYRYALRRGGQVYDSTQRLEDVLHHSMDVFADPVARSFNRLDASGVGTIDVGFDRALAQGEEWAPNFVNTIERTTYTGAWVSGNYAGEVQVPGCREFYTNDTTGLTAQLWPTIPELVASTAAAACRGNGVVTASGDWAINLEVPSLTDPTQYVLLSATSYGGSLESLIGYGSKSYPLGTC